jgi:multimeric flavodoxin WrbA
MLKMNVLGIYGSPRKEGNSDILLSRALLGAGEAGAKVKTIFARDLDIRACLECGGCDLTGKCIVKDKMQEVYPLLEEADAIIMSTPIFFYSMPGKLKSLVDRAQASWSKRMLEKSKDQLKNHESGKGYLIGVGATKGKNLFEGVELIAKYFYDALDMEYMGGVFCNKIEKQGDILSHEDKLKEAYKLGKNIVKGP